MAKYHTRNLKVYGAWHIPKYSAMFGASSMWTGVYIYMYMYMFSTPTYTHYDRYRYMYMYMLKCLFLYIYMYTCIYYVHVCRWIWCSLNGVPISACYYDTNINNSFYVHVHVHVGGMARAHKIDYIDMYKYFMYLWKAFTTTAYSKFIFPPQSVQIT